MKLNSYIIVLLICNCTISFAMSASKPDASQTQARVVSIGPGKEFIFPSVAASFIKDGDIVEIDANGIYDDDTVVWKQSDLVIRGINGRAKIHSHKKITNGKAIWVFKGRNIRVENIEFSGARVNHKNGAGIRFNGENLSVSNCYFHDNENGILTGSNPKSTVLIENSYFERNGHGKGRTHNIYVGAVKEFILKYSYSSHALVGHNVKSRASNNIIKYNTIVDKYDGRSSYSVDIPNGGYTIILGNIIQQSPKTENSIMLNYGSKGLRSANNRLNVLFNTFVNERHAGNFIRVKGNSAVTIANNIFAGKGNILVGKGDIYNNIKPGSNPRFVSRKNFNYSLTRKSPAINKATNDYHDSTIIGLPKYHFNNGKLGNREIIGDALDIGAIESF